jgi:DNA modification methylase
MLDVFGMGGNARGDAGRHLVICGDCRQILDDLSAFDAIVTDPPWGVRHLHSGRGRPPTGRRAGRRHAATIKGDDRPFDPGPWLSRPCLFVGARHFRERLPDGGSWLVWDKREGGRLRDSFRNEESIWCSLAGIDPSTIHYMWKGVMCRKCGEDNGKRYHPTAKPIGLMRQCIRRMGLPPGSLILDPYAGAGSTIIAALEEGHRAIGIEIDPEYCASARRHIAEHKWPSRDATGGRGGVVPPGR